MLAVVYLALALLSLGVLLAAPATPPDSLALLALWAGGALWLERLRVRLPHRGSLGLVGLWTVGCLGTLTQPPVLMAGVLALGWWIVATVRLRDPDWPLLAAEWGPSLLWLPTYQSLAGSGPQIAWLGCGLLCEAARWGLSDLAMRGRKGYAAWARQESLVRALRWGALAAALAFVSVPGAGRWLLLPILGMCAQAARLQASRLRAEPERLRQARQEKVRRTLAVELLAAEPKTPAREPDTLHEQFLLQLREAPEVSQAAAVLGRFLAEDEELRSVGVFWTSTGRAQDLELVWCQSPQAEDLRAVRLVGLENTQLGHALVGQQPILMHPPLWSSEPHALLLPFHAQGLVYAGSPDDLEPAALARLGRILFLARPPFSSLSEQLQTRQRLEQERLRSEALASRMEGQQALLECAYLFSSHLDPEALWQETLHWLPTILSLEGAALCEPDGALRAWEGPAWDEAALRRMCQLVGQSHTCMCLSAPSSRWPLRPGPFSNVAAAPLRLGEEVHGVLLLAFAGQEPLTPGQIDMLQGVADLFGTALARASLHQEILLAHELLKESQDLWLQTQKSRTLAQMAASIAHELNSPLGAIRLALEAALPASAHPKRLQTALEACHRAQDTISRLQRVAASEQEESPSTDLSQLLRQFLNQLEPQLDRLQIRAQVDIPPTLPVPVGRMDLENMTLPLLINALEALAEVPAARRALRVQARQQGGWAIWSVQDSGPGIPAESMPRLTEPFFTTKPLGRSLGLGLSVLEQSCRRCGGELQITSNQGATFRIALPLATRVPPGGGTSQEGGARV